jgi:hypothetical protein
MPLPNLILTPPEAQTPALAPLVLTPSGGSPVTAPTLYRVSYDEVQNVTFEWDKPDRYALPQLQALCSFNVSQYRNRAAAFVCVADPGARLVSATWEELDPLTRAVRPRAARGVYVLKNSVGHAAEAVQLTLYRCTALYVRSTGEVFQ